MLSFAYGTEDLSQIIDEEIEWMQEETFVFTATKTAEKTVKTGSSITVITEDQIWKMSAQNLADILKTVPGLGITVNSVGMTQIESRGIKTMFSEKILVMIDGHPINLQLTNGGSVQYAFDSLPVENIMRVEIVRGPGSALYGANAFLAVINIFTKDAENIDGATLSAGAGSQDTYNYNLLFGKIVKDISVATNINYFDTEGPENYIKQDAVGASGRTLLPTEKYDIDTKLDYKDLIFHAHYASRKSDGSFIGPTNVLNDGSRQDYREWFLELKYKYKVNDKFNIEPRVYYDNSHFDNLWELFSEGFPGFGQGDFPDGMLVRSAASNSKLGAETIIHYEFTDSNKAVFGISAEHQKQYDVEGEQNYNSLTYAPFPDGMQNVTDDPDQIWTVENDRKFYAAFAENIWDIRDDLRFISGIRFDYYSDYGETFNPRASLIWEFIKDWNLRLLYGSAFRDPTFAELYNKNNPAIVGNSNLSPEKITTYELGCSGKLGKHVNIDIAGFYNDINDLIVSGIPNVNSGTVISKGLEFEAKYTFKSDSFLAFNYTFQNSEDKDTGYRVADTPRHRGNIMVNFGLPKKWNFYTHILLNGSASRAQGDEREDTAGYMTVNTALTSKTFLGIKGLDFSLNIYNLFDKDYVYPSSSAVYYDYPASGRAFFTKLNYKFW